MAIATAMATDNRLLRKRKHQVFTLELCAGGAAIGLERAGFSHAALIDNDPHRRTAFEDVNDGFIGLIRSEGFELSEAPQTKNRRRLEFGSSQNSGNLCIAPQPSLAV